MSLKLLTGAAIGGLSQDPLDHPIAGILGSGIGAATAYYSSYSKVVSPFSKIRRAASRTLSTSRALEKR